MRVVTLLILFSTNLASAQICKLFEDIPADSIQASFKKHAFGSEERMKVLAELINPLEIRYVEPNTSEYDEEEGIRYFAIDTLGVYLIDLDMDQDLDLIYTAQSGNMGMMSTSIYLNAAGRLQKDTVISGGLINIYKYESNHFLMYTLWTPCCDSYTNRVEQYEVSVEGTSFKQSISYVGRSRLNHVPLLYSVQAQGTLKKNAVLYAMKLDFKNVHPYFRKDNKAYWEALKQGKPVVMMELVDEVKVQLLGSIKYGNKTYYAVLTDELNAPKSHYEWSAGAHRRFVGWVEEGDLK